MVLIDKDKLEMVMKSHKDEIGIRYTEGIGMLITGASFALALLTAKFSESIGVIPSWIFEILFWGICILAIAYGGWMLYKVIRNKFDYIVLLKEVIGLDEEKHKFSIIAIKDSFEKYPNRFLLCYDERWNCDLFLYMRTNIDEEKNIDNIKKMISNKLKIDLKDIEVEFCGEDTHTKFSQSDKIMKTYLHRIYNVKIARFEDQEKQENFEIDHARYRWMTIQEMEKDPVIREINSDVVDSVKGLVP